MESNADAPLLGLWQKQARQEHVMSLDEVRTKARRLDANTRRWRVATMILIVLVVGIEAWQVWREKEILERTGDLLTIAAFVYIAYRYRKYHLAAQPVEFGSTACGRFYRAELVRQRDLSKDSRGFLLPFVPGVALALFGGGVANRPASQLMTIAAVGVALFVTIAWWNSHTARRLQADIDALDAH